MDLLTIGDFYRKPMPGMELGTSVGHRYLYLAGPRAQLTALGLVFSTLTGGAISPRLESSSAGVSPRLHHLGRMWSVAMTISSSRP